MQDQRWVVAVEEGGASFHDLERMAAGICREYFRDMAPLPIRWGQQITRKKRRSIRLGSYDHRTREVRLHPSLNSPNVPRFFVQSIIYHEYLHHFLGADHDRRFRAFERRFRFHREAQHWLKRNLLVLLGRRERPAPTRALPLRSPGEQLALF